MTIVRKRNIPTTMVNVSGLRLIRVQNDNKRCMDEVLLVVLLRILDVDCRFDGDDGGDGKDDFLKPS